MGRSASNGAKASQTANTRPTENRIDSNLLDLSKPRTKSKGVSSAQSIHGVRKPTHHQPPARTRPRKSKLHVNRSQTRHLRSQQVQKHHKISRFAPSLHTSDITPPQHRSHPKSQGSRQRMSPDRVYEINPQILTSTPPRQDQPKAQPTQRTETVKTHKTRRKTFTNFRNMFGLATKRPRFATVTATLLIVFILGGYITYLNVPSIAVRVAAARAGVDAQLPNYKPPGYEISRSITYSRGQLSIDFNSDANNDHLTLTQRESDWDPQTLLENYVLTKSRNYIAFNQNGLAVYIYNGNHAAWINNGVFYSIEGNTQLNQEHILKMASSL